MVTIAFSLPFLVIIIFSAVNLFCNFNVRLTMLNFFMLYSRDVIGVAPNTFIKGMFLIGNYKKDVFPFLIPFKHKCLIICPLCNCFLIIPRLD